MGIVLHYGFQRLKETAQAVDPSIYFKENDISEQHAVSVRLSYHQQWTLSDRLVFRAGPYLDAGKVFLDDPKITGFNRNGNLLWGLGMDLRLLLKTSSPWSPYLKISAGYSYWDLKLETDLLYAFGFFPEDFSVLEFFGGFVFHGALGVEYRFRDHAEFVLEFSYAPGFVTAGLSGKNAAFFPGGNPYYFHGLKVFMGIQFKVEYNEKK